MSPLVALPAVPATVCSTVGSALGTVGIGSPCTAVSSAATSAAGFGVSSVLDAVAAWVTSGAAWLLSQIGGVVSSTTGLDLGAPWFVAHYNMMVDVAGVVIVPLLLLGILQALYRQSAALLLRTVLVQVPLAILLTAVAVTLVQMGLAVTDSLCATVSGSVNSDVGQFVTTVVAALTPGAAAGASSAPTFALLLGGVAVVIGGVLVWMELLLRSAAVYVAVLFLPLALTGLAWPTISHWSRRLADTLAALILSKLVIVAVLSLGVGAMTTGAGGGGFASILAGAALLLLAGLAPWSLFRMLPFMEAGAVGHLEGLTRRARQRVAAPVGGLASVALRAAAAGTTAIGPVGVIGARAPGSTGPFRPTGTGGSGGLPGRPPGGAAPGGGGPGGGSSGGPSPAEPVLADDGQYYPPGSSIPMHPATPGSDVLNRRLADLVAGRDPYAADDEAAASSAGAPPPGLRPLRPGLQYVHPLPRSSGAISPDHLGRDHLGPVLIGGDQRRDGRPR